jgi:UDP-glucose 4-epimerase
MKYFIIGGSGFIGSSVVEHILSNQNNLVTVYDNLSSGELKYLEKNKKMKFVKGDILNLKKLKESMKGHDFIFHLAANPDIRLGLKNPKLDFNENTIGTLNVLEAMVANKIKKIAFTSTSAVFGTPNVMPTPENYGPCLPESFYGASKLACEGYISAYSSIYDLKAWIFRLANVTGFPGTHGIVYDFYKKIEKNKKQLEVLGDGNQKKSYVTNYMLANAMIKIIEKTKNLKQKIILLNVGNNDGISVKEITKLFLKFNNSNTKAKFTGGKGGWKGDVILMNLDIKKIKKMGWKPTKTSKECIIESIKKNKSVE